MVQGTHHFRSYMCVLVELIECFFGHPEMQRFQPVSTINTHSDRTSVVPVQSQAHSRILTATKAEAPPKRKPQILRCKKGEGSKHLKNRGSIPKRIT